MLLTGGKWARALAQREQQHALADTNECTACASVAHVRIACGENEPHVAVAPGRRRAFGAGQRQRLDRVDALNLVVSHSILVQKMAVCKKSETCAR